MTVYAPAMPQPFRFGLQLHSPIEGLSWLDSARYAEQQGYSSILIPDHFHHQYGPVTALAAAAAVTTELKLGALVFGNDYRHPVMLAKEMATLDQISEGRCEFGLGAGWMRTDYEQSGMTYDRPGVRIDRMIESLAIIKQCWSAEPFDLCRRALHDQWLRRSPQAMGRVQAADHHRGRWSPNARRGRCARRHH